MQASYTADALATMARNPQDRTPGVATLLKNLGGNLHHLFFALGDYDVVILAEMPDDMVATAVAFAASAPGHLKSYKTTRLLSAEEAMEGMRKAGAVTYQAPQG
jgi:uncharacterized protein with GYD domain